MNYCLCMIKAEHPHWPWDQICETMQKDYPVKSAEEWRIQWLNRWHENEDAFIIERRTSSTQTSRRWTRIADRFSAVFQKSRSPDKISARYHCDLRPDEKEYRPVGEKELGWIVLFRAKGMKWEDIAKSVQSMEGKTREPRHPEVIMRHMKGG